MALSIENKQAEDVLECLSQFCWQFGFLQKMRTGYGQEFKDSLMSQFCKNNGITQLHGAPRKPSTQGLAERNNQTIKQNIRNILREKKEEPKRAFFSFIKSTKEIRTSRQEKAGKHRKKIQQQNDNKQAQYTI